jgi:hypothetical protein
VSRDHFLSAGTARPAVGLLFAQPLHGGMRFSLG